MTSAHFADDPITEAAQDRLGRREFASQVARLADQVHQHSETSVMAIIGAWGSGKSSVLSLATAELEHSETDWQIVAFNPWLLSDIDSLIMGFFQALSSALPADGPVQNAKKALGKYAGMLAPFGKLGAIVGLDLGDALKAVSDLASGGSIEKQRDDLAAALRQLGGPILIVLDDLDRLQPTELLLVFKLIRLVGRLPNVHYLLAYDERTVLDLLMHSDLAEGHEDRAQSYLEKIVQLRLDLPPLHSEQVAELLDAGITGLLRQYKLTLPSSDTNRLSQAYHACLSGYLNHPRGINRFLAQAHAVYPLVHTEVNVVDFLLMTFLRTFEPGVYQRIVHHQTELTHRRAPQSSPHDAAFWRSLLGLPEKDTKAQGGLLDLLSQLFLPIRSTIDGMEYGSDFHADLAAHQRVGSSDYFDRYVQFGIVGSDIADATVTRALNQLESGGSDLDALTDRLASDPGPALRKIRAHVDRGTVSNHLQLILYVAEHFEGLRERSRNQFIPRDEHAVLDIAAAAFRHLPGDSHTAIVRALVSRRQLHFAVEFTLKLRKSTNGDDLPAEVRDLLVKALQEHFQARGEEPVQNMPRDDVRLLYFWQHFAGSATPVQEQLWNNIDDGWSLTALLGKLVPEATSFGGSGSRRVIEEVKPAQWDELLNLRRVIAELGDLVDQAEDYIADVDELEPTDALRERYALSVVKRFKQQLAQEDQ